MTTYLIPISAIFLGTLLLGDQLEAWPLPGMAWIGLGLLAIDGRVLARLKRR